MGVKKKLKPGPVIFIVLAVFCSLGWTQDDSNIQVRIEPEEENLPRAAGDTLAVTCIGEGEEPTLFTKMKWIGPSGEVSQNEKEPITATNLETGKLLLVFSKPTPEMSGKYTCTALYDNSVTREDSLTITFYHSITYENCPEQQSVIIGQDGKIRCRVNANPPAQVQWSKDGQILDKESAVLENDGIVIRDVKETDAGVYKVRALVQSTGSLKRKDITVEVHVPPTITELEPEVEIVDGNRKEITCQASGVPAPQYSWFNPKQQNLSDVDDFIVDRNSGTLTFRHVEREHAGTYKCVAVNGAGSAEKPVNVIVIVKPEIRQFNNITSRLNVDSTMECRVMGDPKPEITIRKDGHENPFTNGDGRYSLDTREENEEYILVFTIQSVVRDDDGLYYCAAENAGGRAERVGHVEVQFPPDMSRTPTKERKTWNEHPVNLSCIAEAIPNASIKWYFRSQQIQSNQLYHVYGDSSQSDLSVKPTLSTPGSHDIYGIYRCEASNQYGNNSVEINLQEAHVPERIAQFTFQRFTATTITFMFRGPMNNGGLPITEYTVKYWQKENPSEPEDVSWKNDTSYILEKLNPRTAYVFTFAAKNEVGVGAYTEETEFVMPAESVPEMPTFTTRPDGISSHNPDSYTLRWLTPEDNGKKIDVYFIRYFQVEIDGTDYRQFGEAKEVELRESEFSSGLKYKVENLKPSTYYKVELRAHNEIGNSQPSSITFKTAEGGVSEEQMVANEDGAFLSTPALVAIIIVIILIILGLLDATCYLRYRCGLFYCLRTNVCGHSVSEKVGDGAIEEGKGKELSQQGRKTTDGELATEETPMIDTLGAKDTKASNDHDPKNKSPKGSKSSIAKDSLV